jgi:hypothetical protein
MLRLLALVYFASAMLMTNTPWNVMLVLVPLVLRQPQHRGVGFSD